MQIKLNEIAHKPHQNATTNGIRAIRQKEQASIKNIEEIREKKLKEEGFDILDHSDCTSEIAQQLGLEKERFFLQSQIGQ